MAFDGLFTRAMAKELSDLLVGGRINKIQQPFKNEMVVTIRSKGSNHKLLLSAHPSYARIQVTEDRTTAPDEPPLFCTVLRKHLDRMIVSDIRQSGIDRVITIEMKGRDELGDEAIKLLIIEIMGRHSNIILVEQETGKIIDSIKHIPGSLNSYRTILPGSMYMAPPAQHKLNPLTAGAEDILKNLDFNTGRMDKQLVSSFAGISPVLAKEIVHRAGMVNRTTIPETFIELMEKFRSENEEYAITTAEGKSVFYLLPLTYLGGNCTTYDSLSKMLDSFYFGKAENDRAKQQASDLERLMKNEKTKNEKKILKLRSELQAAEKADELQLLGELLTAHMHLVKKGMKSISVINYYDESGGEMEIPLDPQKSPSENAQYYFTKYQKAKNSIRHLTEQLAHAAEEVNYFDGLLQQLESASMKDIEEIREELIEGLYLKRKARKTTRRKSEKPVPDQYTASDGTVILAGKNNKQNDYLTNKMARRDEIWLHTKDIPGSHIIIRDTDPSEETLKEAAILAAYYSKARDSSSVPVDYTAARHVKKPNGAKPGYVIYDNQQTIFVTPDEDKVKMLKGAGN